MFVPEALRPTPDPWFVRELRKIDPDLRVSFGYERYLMRQWVIERRLSPERYFSIYTSLLESGEPRFIEQPIFDTDQPLYNEAGEQVGYRIVGYRKFDLAPEYECVLFTPVLNEGILGELKRSYAWERNHPLSRLAFEKKQEEEARKAAQAKQNVDIGMEGVREAWRQAGKIVPFAQPEKVLEGTEL